MFPRGTVLVLISIHYVSGQSMQFEMYLLSNFHDCVVCFVNCLSVFPGTWSWE
uniref:Uncharacterized protein n=1 Tax=Arundo donax TaxID=35708 RepID=A0A0A9DPB4_ARUDO